jgi:hypothetical protein
MPRRKKNHTVRETRPPLLRKEGSFKKKKPRRNDEAFS